MKERWAVYFNNFDKNEVVNLADAMKFTSTEPSASSKVINDKYEAVSL